MGFILILFSHISMCCGDPRAMGTVYILDGESRVVKQNVLGNLFPGLAGVVRAFLCELNKKENHNSAVKTYQCRIGPSRLQRRRVRGAFARRMDVVCGEGFPVEWDWQKG